MDYRIKGKESYKIHRSLPLPLEHSSLYLIENDLKPMREELEQFLLEMPYMKSISFSKSVLFSHEIQANNVIEGYRDDVSLVDNVIHQRLMISDEKRRKRILNLYKGYRYILEGRELTEENLKELYRILSDGLLEEQDRAMMGEYYRQAPVYIYYSDCPSKLPDEGVPASEIAFKMGKLFEYLRQEEKQQTLTDTYLVSQIAHFYFLYIHPYFDINGRTSRTTAMWYLLNQQAYPFIIFNRGIQLAKQEYYRVIRDVRRFKNVTFFLNYMMVTVKKELEKEHIMEMISQSCQSPLSSLDYQTMQYMLSMNGQMTYYDFVAFYNRQNEKKSKKEIIETMIYPLIDKGIILPGRKIERKENRFFSINPSMYELDPEKVKRIRLAQKKS